MLKQKCFFPAGFALALALGACNGQQASVPVNSKSAVPGTEVSRQGEKLALTGTGIEVGKKLPETGLVDAATIEGNQPQ